MGCTGDRVQQKQKERSSKSRRRWKERVEMAGVESEIKSQNRWKKESTQRERAGPVDEMRARKVSCSVSLAVLPIVGRAGASVFAT